MTSYRAGIVGRIYGYPDAGGMESHGQGLDIDAAALSREFTSQSIRLVRKDGKTQWFERGREIAQPEWFDGDA